MSAIPKPVFFLSTLSVAHVAGDGQLVLQPGDGARLGTLAAGQVYALTAVIAPGLGETILANYRATGLSTDTLTGVTADAHSTDTNVPAGTPLQVRLTPAWQEQVQDGLAGLDSLTATVATNTANIATNTTNIAGNTANIAANTSAIAANTTAIAARATDTLVVHLAGTETIAGAKTFSAAISGPGAGASSERFGAGSLAGGTQATALGKTAKAADTNATAVGYAANAAVNGSTAIGTAASATVGDSPMAIGVLAAASGTKSVAIGYQATVSGIWSVAVGLATSATAPNAIAIGNGAIVTHDSAFSLGAGAASTATNQLVFGGSGAPINQMSPVADGAGFSLQPRSPSSTSTLRTTGYLTFGYVSNVDASYTGYVSLDVVDAGGRRAGIKVQANGANADVVIAIANVRVAANDAAAAALVPPVPVGALYRSGSQLFIRVT